MTEPYFDDGQVRLFLGDSLDVLPTLPGASVDAVVCDPPYGLEFMGAEWDAPWKTGNGFRRAANEADAGRDNAFGRASRTSPEYVAGRGFQDWCEAWAAECLRVLKPGGHLLAFGGTRTYHRLACGIEDAGFEVRDSIHWIYGSGFPKSLDVSKATDKAAGAQREVVGEGAAFGRGSMRNRSRVEMGYRATEVNPDGGTALITAPATDEAARWSGWGTALKPSHEPVVVARKALDGTVAANVLEHGTGALNIDGCRVEGDSRRLVERRPGGDVAGDVYARDAWSREHMHGSVAAGETNVGRWPSNLVLTHAPDCDDACAPGCPVAELDRQSGVLASGANPTRRASDKFRDAYGDFPGQRECTPARGADSGGASRFFPVFRYEAKASAAERPKLPDGTAWPTVKPVELMRWLVRLVTPPGGLVLDPFCGTGATGEAAIAEGFRCVLVEKDPVAAELAMVRLRKPIQPSLFGDLGAAS